MIDYFELQFNYLTKKDGLSKFIKRVYSAIKFRYLVEPTIFLNKNPRYNQWEIGDYSYCSTERYLKIVYYGEEAQLKIGKFCSFAAGVNIFLGGNHRIDWVTTFPFTVFFNELSTIKGHPISKGNIEIGNDVWVGEDATILSGIKIGNGAVIASKSVVTKDVPPYTIVAGNPAKIIKQRFDDATVVGLEHIAWWNWNIDKIIEQGSLMLNTNIAEFIKKNTQ